MRISVSRKHSVDLIFGPFNLSPIAAALCRTFIPIRLPDNTANTSICNTEKMGSSAHGCEVIIRGLVESTDCGLNGTIKKSNEKVSFPFPAPDVCLCGNFRPFAEVKLINVNIVWRMGLVTEGKTRWPQSEWLFVSNMTQHTNKFKHTQSRSTSGQGNGAFLVFCHHFVSYYYFHKIMMYLNHIKFPALGNSLTSDHSLTYGTCANIRIHFVSPLPIFAESRPNCHLMEMPTSNDLERA